jgi:hypothetical protein
MESPDQLAIYVQAVLHEYDSLRSESKDARAAQRSALTLGAVGVSAVAGLVAGAIEEGVPLLSVFMLLFVLPGLATMTMVLWMGEFARMRRAGGYLQEVEQKVTCALQAAAREVAVKADSPEDDRRFAPLRWEQWVQETEETRHLTWLYQSILSVARAASVVSPLLAVPVVFASSLPGDDRAWQYSVLGVAVAGSAFQLWISTALLGVLRPYVGQVWPEATWSWLRHGAGGRGQSPV